jgi:molybdate transport system permease protein
MAPRADRDGGQVIDSELVGTTLLTVRVALLATLVALAPAVGLGYVLARHRFRGRTLVQALVSLPMVLPPVAVGLGLLILLGRQGPLGGLWRSLDIDIVFTWWAAVLAAATVGFPLLVRACQQSFAEVDPRYEDVARTLGLGRLHTFVRVTLPLARRGVLYGALLCFTRGLGEFGATALVAGIIPGHTETLSLGIWSRVQLGDDGGALALCGASIALAFASMLVAEGWLRKVA